MPKSLPNTAHKSGPLLSSREEAVRFAEATDRFLERAQQDPRVAEKFLRDIGYYEIMEAQEAEAKEVASQEAASREASTMIFASAGDNSPEDNSRAVTKHPRSTSSHLSTRK